MRTRRGQRASNVTKTSRRTSASPKPSRRPRVAIQPIEREPHVKALLAFADLARRARLRWYVFGAQAVNLHGFPRATADLDVTVELGTRSVANLLLLLARAGFEPRFADDAFAAAARVIPAVHRGSGLPIDVVLGGPGLEQRFLDEVVLVQLGRRRIPVLSAENLIVTKLLAGRAKDLEDVRELLAVRGEDIDRAHIEQLVDLLDRALDQADLRPLFKRLCEGASRTTTPTVQAAQVKRGPRRGSR